MKKVILENNLQFILFQRNVFLFLTCAVSISLIFTTTFLFWKSERVIVAPPVIEKQFWVDAYGVSPSYLEQIGQYLGQLLLSKSSASAATQRSILLQYADPSYASLLRQKLVEEEEMLKKQNSSYVFYLTNMEISIDTMSVALTGNRVIFVSGKEVSSEQETYKLYFTYNGANLLLKSIASEDKANKREKL